MHKNCSHYKIFRFTVYARVFSTMFHIWKNVCLARVYMYTRTCMCVHVIPLEEMVWFPMHFPQPLTRTTRNSVGVALPCSKQMVAEHCVQEQVKCWLFPVWLTTPTMSSTIEWEILQW